MKNLKTMQRHLERGFTLIELGIAIAIAAVVVGVGLMVVPQMLADNKVSSEIATLGNIASRTQKTWASKTTYTGSTLQNMIDADVFPAMMVSSDRATVTSQWGGLVTVASATDAELQIKYASVPAYECRNLLPQVERMFGTMKVGADSVKAVGGTFQASTAATKCSEGTNGKVDITLGIPK